MVTRKRLRSILTALGLYVCAALLIGYFGVNAYTGNHGLSARQDLDLQIAQLTANSRRSRPNAAMGTARRVAQIRQLSIPTCWTSAPARCSTMSIRATSTLMLRPASVDAHAPAARTTVRWALNRATAATRLDFQQKQSRFGCRMRFRRATISAKGGRPMA